MKLTAKQIAVIIGALAIIASVFGYNVVKEVVVTPPPIAVKELPFIDITNPVPEGANTKRLANCQWLALWDVYDDAYGEGEPKLRADYSEQLDAYVKRVMAQPEGKRCMHEWHWANSGWVNPRFNVVHHAANACKDKDGSETIYTDFNNRKRPMICPWFDGGVKASAEKWTWLMTELKKRGMKLDYFTTENESGYTPWSFVAGQTEAIDKDPRAKEIYNELKINSVTEASNFFNHRDDFIKMNDYFNWRAYLAFVDGMYKPILAVYPEVKISDYAKMCIKVQTWETNGWPMKSEYCDPKKMVSNGTDLFYLGGGAFLSGQHGNQETGYLENTPWNAFIMSLNQARAIRISNPDGSFWPSMASPNWITWSTPQIIEEHWKHLSLMVDGFVLWGPSTTAKEYELLNKWFAEIDPLVGFADRKSNVTELLSWQAKEVKTCAKANGKEVCRVTEKDQPGYWLMDGKKI